MTVMNITHIITSHTRKTASSGMPDGNVKTRISVCCSHGFILTMRVAEGDSPLTECYSAFLFKQFVLSLMIYLSARLV